MKYLEIGSNSEVVSDQTRHLFRSMLNRLGHSLQEEAFDVNQYYRWRKPFGYHLDYITVGEIVSSIWAKEAGLSIEAQAPLGLYLSCYWIGKPPPVRHHLHGFRTMARNFAIDPNVQEQLVGNMVHDPLVRRLADNYIEHVATGSLPYMRRAHKLSE